MIRTIHWSGACLAFGLLCASGAQAAIVTNGSLTGPIANGGVPSGWTVMLGSPDTMDASANVGVPGLGDFGAAPGASPDGGTWVGMGSDVGFVERFGQTLTGLTVGQTYSISWAAGNFGYSPTGFGYINPNAIAAMIDGSVVGTGGTLALSSNWMAQSVSFVASATTHQLAFQLATDAKSYMSIDGINVSAVPEPSTIALMLAGVGLVALRTQRRAKTPA